VESKSLFFWVKSKFSNLVKRKEHLFIISLIDSTCLSSFNYQSSCIVEAFNYFYKKKQKKKLLNLSTINQIFFLLKTINQFKVVFQASIIIGMSERLYINSAKSSQKKKKKKSEKLYTNRNSLKKKKNSVSS
jgi:acetone carboxylase gamma subunit